MKDFIEDGSVLPTEVLLHIDALCDDFHNAWSAGQTPRLEDFLGTLTGPGRARLLRELLEVELEQRKQVGETPARSEYLRRFPLDADPITTAFHAAGLEEEAPVPPATLVPVRLDQPGANTLTLPPATVAELPTADFAERSSGTASDATGQVAPARDDRAPPGYEIERELGRGGMGVVYLARQTKLARPCALKMILAGEHAGEAQRERFLTEAQAIARLQHPGIVQVFEVGEHHGHAFMALELCPAGSLDQRLRAKPPTATEAATLVRSLAEAMQVAHEMRVIHRDLKPANVLIAADGTLKITDFGLAKKLDEADQTQTGDVMGTPSYMPPEQARGAKNLGPAADIYALGAILYAALTGRPPFRGATVLETLHQVLNQEPVAVQELNPAIPRDLATIVHKCLQKDPRRRYASARDLANDLGHFLAGRPILARPVGILERGVRWVRRNPLVSSLVASVFFVLTAGVVAASLLAAWALVERKNAKNEQRTAEEQTRKALLANDGRLSSVARSWIRPLALLAQPGQPVPPLSEPEIEALWELITEPDDLLHLRFVQVALEKPAFTRQLKDRAALALHAVVGLNRTRRQQIEGLLAQALQEKTDPQDQGFVALCLVQLGGLERAQAGTTAATLSRALCRKDPALPPGVLLSLAEGLAAVAVRAEPREAVALLVQTMNETTDPDAVAALARGLLASSANLEAKEVAAQITQAMTGTNRYSLRSLAVTLAAVSANLEATEAAAVCGQAADTLSQALTQTADPNVVFPLAVGLIAVARRLESLPGTDPLKTKAAFQHGGELKRVAGRLAQAHARTGDHNALGLLAQALAAVTVSMEAKDAASLLIEVLDRKAPVTGLQVELASALVAATGRLGAKDAVATFIQALGLKGSVEVQILKNGLLSALGRLEPREAVPLLTRTLCTPPDSRALQILPQGLARAVARLEPAEAAALCSPAAITLTQVMRRTTRPSDLEAQAEGLRAVAGHLTPKEATQIVTDLSPLLTPVAAPALVEMLVAVTARQDASDAVATLTQALARTPPSNPGRTLILTRALATASARLEPKEAVASLDQAMTRTTDPNFVAVLAEGLVLVAARVEPAEALPLLTQAMTRTTYPAAQKRLTAKLLAVVASLPPGACGAAATLLAQAIPKTTDPGQQGFLALSLLAVAARLEPKDEAVHGQAATAFLQAVSRAAPHFAQALAEELAGLAPRLDPKEAQQVTRQAAAHLVQAMLQPVAILVQGSLDNQAQGLSALVQGLPPREAAEILLRAMSRTTNAIVLSYLTQILPPVASRLEAKEAATVCGQAATVVRQALPRAATAPNVGALARGLAAVASHLEPKEAGEVAAALIQAMSRSPDPNALKPLALGMKNLVDRLGPTEAAQAASALIQALRVPGNPLTVSTLTEALEAVAARMDAKEAAQAVVTVTGALNAPLSSGLVALTARLEPKEAVGILTHNLSKATDPAVLKTLVRGLAAVGARVEVTEAVALLTQAMTGTTNPDTAALLAQGLAVVVVNRETSDAADAAATLLQAMTRTTSPVALSSLSLGLAAILSRDPTTITGQRLGSLAAMLAVLATAESPLGTLALAGPVVTSPPPPLPVVDLVELLKNPFCVGPARRLVLEQLSRHYHRPFVDQWEFVDFVERNKLDLDLTTPPRRPASTTSSR
jgi:hypothetical protein